MSTEQHTVKRYTNLRYLLTESSKRLLTNQKSVATQMPTPTQSMNTTHIRNLKNPTTLSRSTMAKPTDDTAHISDTTPHHCTQILNCTHQCSFYIIRRHTECGHTLKMVWVKSILVRPLAGMGVLCKGKLISYGPRQILHLYD